MNSKYDQEDVDVDLEGELIYALDDLRITRKEKLEAQRILKDDLKYKISNRRRKEERRCYENKIKGKKKDYERLDVEVVSLRNDLEEANSQLDKNLNFGKSAKIRDGIINI